MPDCFIYDHVRTPRGKGRPEGALHRVTALELASQALAAIPVLIVTGRSDADTRKRVAAMGVAPVLTKPVDTEVLLAAVRAALETKPE